MREVERIANQIRRAYHDGFWGGGPDDLGHSGESDWPMPAEATATGWDATLADLDRGLEALVEAARTLDPEQLDTLVGAKRFTMYEMLPGIPQHDLYHAGQVLILRKAIRGG